MRTKPCVCSHFAETKTRILCVTNMHVSALWVTILGREKKENSQPTPRAHARVNRAPTVVVATSYLPVRSVAVTRGCDLVVMGGKSSKQETDPDHDDASCWPKVAGSERASVPHHTPVRTHTQPLTHSLTHSLRDDVTVTPRCKGSTSLMRMRCVVDDQFSDDALSVAHLPSGA